MSYVQLVRGNDWGQEYFARPFHQVDANGMADVKKLGLRFVEGAQVRVRWPNGDTSIERIEHKTQYREVSDHGNRYSVQFALPGITVDAHSIPLWLPLDAVKVHDGDIPTAGPNEAGNG